MSSTSFDPDEERLRTLFRRLKKDDAEHIPDFARMFERARSAATEARPQRSQRTAFAFAAGLLLFLFLVTVFLFEDPVKNGSDLDAIFRWNSPTGFLLQPPGKMISATIPELGKPLVPVGIANNPVTTEDL